MRTLKVTDDDQLKGSQYERARTLVLRSIHEIDDFAHLTSNWDSYGGEPPTDLSRSAASALLQTVQRLLGLYVGERIEPEYVAPRADGGIEIEWASGQKKVIVAISATGTFSYLFVEKNHGARTSEEFHDVTSSQVTTQVARALFAVA